MMLAVGGVSGAGCGCGGAEQVVLPERVEYAGEEPVQKVVCVVHAVSKTHAKILLIAG